MKCWHIRKNAPFKNWNVYNLKGEILYCFPTFTWFDSPWVYIYEKKRVKAIKKKACNFKNLAIQRGKEKVPNRKFKLTLTSISSVQIHIHSDQNSVFQTNKHTKKENPKVGEKEEEEKPENLCSWFATAKTEKICSSSATSSDLEAILFLPFNNRQIRR